MKSYPFEKKNQNGVSSADLCALELGAKWEQIVSIYRQPHLDNRDGGQRQHIPCQKQYIVPYRFLGYATLEKELCSTTIIEKYLMNFGMKGKKYKYGVLN